MVKKQKPVHPGEVLRLELEARDMKQSELAKETGFSTAYISDVLRQKRRVSSKMAHKLAKALGGPAKLWNDLQADYDLEIAREE